MTNEGAGAGGEAAGLLSWPPPGLGRIQGDLWVVVRKLALAAVVFVLPLLAMLTVPEREPGLGPLGDAWWVTVVTSLLGVGLFADAVAALVRLMLRVRAAVASGYPARTVGAVISDRDRDGGFLLQGAHAFSSIPEEVRRVLARARLLAASFCALATAWVVFGFGFLVVLAARGILTPSGLLVWTLAPAALLGAGGLVLRAVAGSLSRRARRSWHRHPWAEDLVQQDVVAWKERAREHGVAEEDGAGLRRALGSGVVVTVVAAIVTVLPPATLVPVSSTGAILAEMASARFDRTRERAAEAEAYRSFRLEADPAVSAEEAGELLNVLAWVGAEPDLLPGQRPPVRRYDEPWFPPDPPASLEVQIPPLWSDSLWMRADGGLPDDEAAYLRRVASNPAHEVFARLAGAGALDFAGGLYETPFDARITLYDVPIPRLHLLRLGGQAHLAAAALASAEGRHEDAERMTREVVSVGLLLLDESPILIGSLIGAAMADSGGDALRHALRRAGREYRLEGLDAAVGAASRATAVAGADGGPLRPSGDSFLRSARAVAADTMALRGLRWEFAHVSAIATPCLNMRTIVFGPGIEYDRWLAGVRSSLVRYEAEDALFDLAARGLALEGASSSTLARVLTLAMGGGNAPASCARFIATLQDM
jgi:hypothetical protein